MPTTFQGAIVKSEFDDSYLKRLPPSNYRGLSYVHWSLTIKGRKSGWLTPLMLYKFRELLTHTMFRYALCCPIFVLMPDHLHLLWMGIVDDSDQLLAMKHFRTRLNRVLNVVGFELQKQAYDNVLKNDQRLESSIMQICEYIARNPERANLVKLDGYTQYSYTGCIVPGYPELKLYSDDFWPRFWRVYSFLQHNGLTRTSFPAAMLPNEKSEEIT